MNPRAAMAAGAAALTLITGFEGLRRFAYYDPPGIPTVCYGHTGPDVKFGREYSFNECTALLQKDVSVAAAAVQRAITRPIPQPTFDALVSFTYNVGEGSLRKSTLLKKLNAGDVAGACRELPKWVYAGGVKLNGLVKRRAAEMALCLKGV